MPSAPPALTSAPGHESEAETIARCLDDARSDDVRLRRRAILILGKYRAPGATAAVVAGLRDPDDEVRRSAAVAVSEWDVVPREALADLLRLVGDGNVQVRRVASSMLPEMVAGRASLAETMVLTDRLTVQPGTSRPVTVIGGRAPTPGQGLPPPEDLAAAALAEDVPLPRAELIEVLNRALGDEDPTVRRNVLTAARYLPGVLTRAALEPLVQDGDREIRILAVQAFARLRGDEAARSAVLAVVASDADSTVRREVARAMGRLGGSGFAGLEGLAADADPGVRRQAVQELVQLQHPRGLEYLEGCVLDDAVPVDERRSLLIHCGFYGERARPLLTRLSTAGSSLLRAEAVRGLARLQGEGDSGPGFLVSYLADESPEVRRMAADGLARWVTSQRARNGAVPWPGPADIAALLASRYADVRLLGVRFAGTLAPEARLDALTDACLDDDVPVRCEAILSLALMGTPQALDLVARSLDDPQHEVALAAVRALAMRPQPQSRQQLQSFHDRCTDAALKAMVAAVLAGMDQDRPGLVRPQRWPVSRNPGLSPTRPRRQLQPAPGPRPPPATPVTP